MSNPYPTPHINATPEDFAKTVLMPGDPLRAKFIAENFLTDAKLVNNVRGIHGYTGLYDGARVSVMASGMGMPSIGIYSYEPHAIEDGGLTDTILRPRYIPDGYELTDETHTDTSAVLEYSKANRHLIYNQKIITNEKMIFDMSFDRVERIGINGMTVLVYWYQDDTFWAYGEYGNSIYILAGDSIETDEIQKIYKHWIW